MQVSEEGWVDGTAPVTDWTKALKPTLILDVEGKDNYSKVPHSEPVKLYVWA